MKIYFAPMEGITGYVYRNVYNSHFKNIDRYYTPFVVGNVKASMKSRELKDVLPDNNKNITVIPQILSRQIEEFVNTAKRIESLGYGEVNLNLGCPSGTVVSKGRGSGFLAFPDELDNFFENVFQQIGDLKLSIKTRIGVESEEEFDRILEIYNKYPFSELIIHPRIQKQGYNGKPDMKSFDKAYHKNLSYPIIYNGDIRTVEDFRQIEEKYPDIDGIMIGRGILINPFLVDKIKGIDRSDDEKRTILKDMYMELFDNYRPDMSCDKDVLFRLKELWTYQMQMFEDIGNLGKKVLKSKDKQEFLCAMKFLIDNCKIKDEL